MTTNRADIPQKENKGTSVEEISKPSFVERIQQITIGVSQTLNAGLHDPETVSGVALCAVQLHGKVTCVVLDSTDKSVSPGIRMASSMLATVLQEEKNPRVIALLNKALKLSEEALKIRSGEIISTKLH